MASLLKINGVVHVSFKLPQRTVDLTCCSSGKGYHTDTVRLIGCGYWTCNIFTFSEAIMLDSLQSSRSMQVC